MGSARRGLTVTSSTRSHQNRDEDRRNLTKRTARVQQQMHSKNTRATYKSGVLQYMIFVGWFYPMLCVNGFVPPTDELLAEFLVFQSALCRYIEGVYLCY